MTDLARGHRFEPDVVYLPAPAGTRVRFVTTAVFVLVTVVTGIIAVVTITQGGGPVIAPVIATACIFPLLAVMWFLARIRCYRVTADELFVEGTALHRRFSLAGLKSAEIEPDATAGARKIIGNDGLGAMAGRFRNKKLGRFNAYVTDAEKCVVLRWPEQIVVVSPAHPREFADLVRKRAGTPRA